MALTNQPYLPLYVQDWLSNNKLKLCTPGAHGLMINIMCLMHKSDEYGTILLQQKFKQTTKQSSNFAAMIARLLPFEFAETEHFLNELLEEEILKIDGEKMFCERMVKDADLSVKRSLVGSKGGKNTSKNNKKFAVAKVQANAEIETDIISEVDIKIKKQKIKNDEPIYRSFKHLCLYQSEFDKLFMNYTKEEIDTTLDAIENHKNNKNYTSLYLTANTWLKKDLERKLNTEQNGTKQTAADERLKRANEISEVSRLAKTILSNIDY